MTMKINSYMSDRKIIPYLFLTMAAALLVYRCFFSFVWSDESFYLSLVHRFWVGDRPIVDEWSGVQLYSIILLPIYSIYRFLVGSSDGVYLFFRILMVLAEYALSLYIFRSLCRSSDIWPAFLGALSYLLYTRANILGASYYSFALLFFTYSLFLILNAENDRKSFRFVWAGCMMALAVLALPYLAVIYILTVCVILIIPFFRKFRAAACWTAAGTCLCAVIYCVFLLSRANLGEIWRHFPYLLGDKEHEHMNVMLSMAYWFARIIYRYKYTVPLNIICFLYILFRIKEREKTNSLKNLIYVAISLIIFAINIILSENVVGCVNIAMSILAVELYSLTIILKQIKCQKKLCFIYFGGILFSMAFHYGSNTGLDSMTTGFAICAIASPVMIWDSLKSFFVKEKKIRAKSVFYTVTVFLFLVASFQSGWLRWFGVYRDGNMKELTVQLTDGPARYLYTTEEHAGQYMELVEAIRRTCPEKKDAAVVFVEMAPWAYLCVDSSCGAPSPCRFSGGLSSDNLEKYYEEDPERFPDYVCDIAPEYGSFRSVYIQGNEESLTPNGTDAGRWLIEAVQEKGYAAEETSCGVIYTRR